MIKLSFLNRVFDFALKFIVQSSFLLAIYGVALLVFFEDAFEFETIVLLFFSIVVAYLSLRIYGQFSFYFTNVLKANAVLKQIFLFLLFPLILLICALIFSDFTFKFFNIFHAIAIVFLILYVVLRFHIKSIDTWYSFAKIGVVAIVWSLFMLGFLITPNFFIGVSIFFLILGLMIPFEIKDLKKDYEDNILSVVHVFGMDRSRIIGYFFFILSSLFFMFYTTHSNHLLAWLVSCFIGALLLYFSDESKRDFYYFVLVDGVLALPLIFKLIFIFYCE